MHRNAEIIRRGYQAFNTADMTTLTELFDENASWHTPGRGSIAGDRVGRDAVFAQFGRYGGETGGTFKAELRHVLADDEGRVVGIHHNSGVRNGQQLDVDCCIVFEIRSGRITSGREHFYNLHAWEQFWAEPNESRLCRAGTGGSIMPPPNNRMQRTAPGVSSRMLSAHFQKEPRR